MKLTSKGREETSQGGDEAAQDRRQPGGLPPADADRQRGDAEGEADGERTQPNCKESIMEQKR